VNWVARALNRGWHVGLIGSQDTHTDDWGDGTRWARTAMLMRANTPAEFREALLARRFYATTDANLDVRFDAGEAGVMGARIRRPVGATVPLTVNANDPDGEAIQSIELLTGGPNDTFSVVGTAAGTSSLSVPVTSDWGERWYLARVTQADGEKAYTSPIWLGANVHPYGEWLGGDLHVHTQNGHDTCVTPEKKFDNTPCDEPWTWSFSPAERIALAKERGLDYLAITDHSNVMSQSDPAYLAERSLILVPAYENSLPGHAQMLGATH
jgi:hypothetical protein